MKKITGHKNNKLTLNKEIVRCLTSDEMTLVAGGACLYGSEVSERVLGLGLKNPTTSSC